MGGIFGGGQKPKKQAPPPKVIAPTPQAVTATEDQRSIALSQGEESKRRRLLSSRDQASTGASTGTGGGRSLLG